MINLFDDIHASLAADQRRFAESVQDSFGASVVSDIYEPIVAEAGELALLQDDTERELRDAGRVLEEARSLGELDLL